MIALAASLGLLKITAVIFSAVVVVVPRERFAGARGKLIFGVTCVGASVAVGIACNAAFPFIPGKYWKTGADPNAALHVLVAHPLHLAATLMHAAAQLPCLWQSSYGRIGAQPNIGGAKYPDYIGWAGLVTMIVLALTASSGCPRRRPAAVMMLISLASMLMLSLAFRIAFNAPMVDEVSGIQGRYLHPVEFLLLLGIVLLLPWRGSEAWRRRVQLVGFVGYFAIQAATIMIVIGWERHVWSL